MRSLDSLTASAALIQSRKQTKLLAKMTATQQPASRPAAAPPGWYPAHGDPVGSVRFWDGAQWTTWFKP